MANVIVILVLLLIVGAVAVYVIKAKKKGQKCIGCPYANKCGVQAGCSCGGNSYVE